MKGKKIAKKGMCFMLSAVLSAGALQGFCFETKATEAISYNFSNSVSGKAGYAEGKVSFTAPEAGNYYLYWANEHSTLEGFYPILSGKNMAKGEKKEVTFGYHTAIPAGAIQIVAIDKKLKADETESVSKAKAVYSLPEEKLLCKASGELQYTFSSYSDVHLDARLENNGQAYWKNAAKNWEAALNYAVKKDTDFICSSGDMATNNDSPEYVVSEWELYTDALVNSGYQNPVWESNGNHDMKQEEGNILPKKYKGNKAYLQTTGTEEGTCLKNLENETPYYYVVEEKTGDVFIFMALENGSSPGSQSNFSKAQITWLEDTVKKYYGTGVNVYIIEHSTIKGFGAGDNWKSPCYGGHMNGDTGENKAFKQVLITYPDLIWMSGHTHIDFENAELYENANYSNQNNTACNMIHNSAVVGSCKPDSNGKNNYNSGTGFNSQGYYVEAYENEVVYYGANLTDQLIYPTYCYIMEGSRKDNEKARVAKENPASVQISKEIIADNATLEEALMITKCMLSNYYMLSSYDQYQNLRSLYSALIDKTSAYSDADGLKLLKAMTKKLYQAGEASKLKPRSTFYFQDKNNWGTVYGYAFNSKTKENNAAWPGVALSSVGKQNNASLYKFDLGDYARKYDRIIFTNGSKKTVNITMNLYAGNAYYPVKESNGKYVVDAFVYGTDEAYLGSSMNEGKVVKTPKESGRSTKENPTITLAPIVSATVVPSTSVTVTEAPITPTPTSVSQPTITPIQEDRYVFNYYKAAAHEWGSFDSFMKPIGDGIYFYTYVADDSTDISMNVYDKESKKYYLLDGSQYVNYALDYETTFDEKTADKKTSGTSITLKNLSKGNKVNFIFDPANMKITVTTKEVVIPTVTKEPSVTEEPEVTKEPSVTKEPEVTKEPSVTEELEVTKEPSVTEEPEVTKKPSVTEEPEVTKEPSVTEEPEVTKKPSVTEEPEVTKEPSVTEEPEVTKKPSVTETPKVTKTPRVSTLPSPTKTPKPTKSVKKGTVYIDTKTKNVYQVTGVKGTGGIVSYVGCLNKKRTKIVIPEKVSFEGRSYTVVSVKAKAFKNNQKLRKVIIGKNIKKIGKEAFMGCKCLKEIKLKTKNLTAKSVGKNAFKNVHKKVKVTVPKGKRKVYTKLLQQKGIK